MNQENIERKLYVFTFLNSQFDETEEPYRVVFVALKEPLSIKYVTFLKSIKEKIQQYVQYVRLHDDGETILIKHLEKEFIFPKFRDHEQIIWKNHTAELTVSISDHEQPRNVSTGRSLFF